MSTRRSRSPLGVPEGIEIEFYRRASLAALDRRVESVRVQPADFARNASASAIADVIEQHRFVAARRRGKLLLLDTAGATLGIRFGMTGRLIVDGHAVIDKLEYSSGRNDEAWDRLVIRFADGGFLAVRDQRRLGNVELNPDEDALGPDVFDVSGAQLGVILSASSRPLKARLMDQSRLAGLGNLLTDEILWRSSLDPERPADSLDTAERRRLLHHLRRTLAQLTSRGGSHTGDLQDQRHDGGRCPRDGAELMRSTVGGRTTYSCSEHQRARD
jgi:formamidopyrimidine-DNA glycosylase